MTVGKGLWCDVEQVIPVAETQFGPTGLESTDLNWPGSICFVFVCL